MALAQSRAWLVPVGWLALAACGTASAPSSSAPGPGPVASVALPTPSAAASATIDCPDEQEHRPGQGCVYVADGTPPTGKGAGMRPVPDGRRGDAVDGPMVSSFWIDERAATVADYRACVEAGACDPPEKGEYCSWGASGKEAEPVGCVSWHHAQTYCDWAGKRLPTDAEWDRVAPKHEAYGVTGLGGDRSEWTGSYYCAKQGGCAHSRVLRGHRKPAERERQLPDMVWPRFAFRCAWSAADLPPSQAPPPLVALRTTTPGQILCNTTLCDLATSACCHNTQDGVGRCVPKDERRCTFPELWTTCDEHADCGGGKNCCPSWGCSGGCPEERICVDGPCEQGDEICLPGGDCRPGYECKTEPGQRRGRCRWANVGAWCGTKRCSGDQPRCCLPEGKTSGYCTAEKCQPKERTLACSSPRDCGGSTCGGSFTIGASPEVNDGSLDCVFMSHLIGLIACDTVRDCPSNHPPSGAQLKGCSRVSDLPRGVKQCVYDGDMP